MNPTEFIMRIIGGVLSLIFLVLLWALVPYINGVHEVAGGLDTPIVSVFFGRTEPRPIVTILLLLSRGSFGLMVSGWLLIPTIQFFTGLNFRPLARAAVIVFMSCSTATFFGALILHFLHQRGGF